MSDVQRPTVLTVLAVLALIGGVLSIIGGVIAFIASFPVLALSVGAGIVLLVAGLMALASGVVGLLAGIKIFGNKPKGIYFLKLYAYIGIAYAVVGQIGAVIQAGGAGFSVSGLIRGLVFPVIVLVIIMTQQTVKDYESQVG